MKNKFIGAGAAGNKALAELLNQNIVAIEDCLMLNTTLADIPTEYYSAAVKFGITSKGGCGKERKKAHKLLLESIQNNQLDHLLELLRGDADNEYTVFIITGTEGGSGSGSAPLISEYYRSMPDPAKYKVHTHIVAFPGFENDARGIANTLEFFKELNDEITIHTISNKKFLTEANGNHLKAEILANKELATRMTILLGQSIVESSQNIDLTDLSKVVNTPGYTIVETALIGKDVKNLETYNKLIGNMIDATKSIDIEDKSAVRLAVIFNIKDSTSDIIDHSHTELLKRLGMPYEIFIHVQNTGDVEFISIIASGLKLPMGEIEDIYARYQEAAGKVDINKDKFFNQVEALSTSNSRFDMEGKAPSVHKELQNKFMKNTQATVISNKEFVDSLQKKDKY